MTRIAALTGLAWSLALLAAPALAKGEIPFEKAKGWDIERTAPGAKARTCMMSKSYKDPDDDNAENALVFLLVDGQAYITFVYEHWTWDKDEKLRVPFLLDKKVAIAKSTWTGDGQVLSTVVPDSIVPNMLAARKMVLKLDGADADFDLAGFPEAYESLRRCDATPAHAVAPAPAAPQPAEARIKAFFLGAMFEAAMKECDVATTGRQRTAFGEKLGVLRKEMGPLEADLQAGIDKRPEPRCPTAQDAPKLQRSVQDFIDKTPEEFLASVESRAAEAEKTETPKP